MTYTYPILSPPPTAAEKAIEERNKLYRAYRKQKHRELERLFADHTHGEQLRKFAATLGHFGPDSEDRLFSFVSREAYEWLRNAPDEIRFAALQMISSRCIRNNVRAGKPPLNDPLPGQPDDIFRLCKRELGL